MPISLFLYTITVICLYPEAERVVVGHIYEKKGLYHSMWS